MNEEEFNQMKDIMAAINDIDYEYVSANEYKDYVEIIIRIPRIKNE